MKENRVLIFLWILFFALTATLIYLLYYLYAIVWPEKEPEPVLKNLIPLGSIYGFGKKAEDLFNKPHDVCVDNEGNLIVSDTRNSRVVKITPAGRLIQIYKDKLLLRPLGLTVSGDGKIYVTDRFSQALLIFNRNGSVEKRIAVEYPLKPFFYKDRVYLATRSSVAVLSFDGRFLFHFGRMGRQQSEFAYPNGLFVNDEGIFVSDTNNLRVQCFTLRGEFRWVQGSPPKSIDEQKRTFSLPSGICSDSSNRLYVVDAFSNSIVILDSRNGKIIKRVGGVKGDRDGQFNQPSGIAYLGDELFVVADKYNDRLQFIRIPLESKEGKKTEKSEPLGLALRIFIPILILTLILFFVGRLKIKRES